MRSAFGLAAVLIVAGGPASATPIIVDFTGIAQDSRIAATSPQPGSFNGQRVSGQLVVDPATLASPGPGSDTAHGEAEVYLSAPASLTIDAAGQQVVFGTDDGLAVDVINEPGGPQSIRFDFDFTNPYYNADVTLTGDLFLGLDPLTFHPGGVTVSQSSAYFFAGRDFGATIDISSVAFQSVPEPASLLLLGSGLGLWAWRGRRQRPGRGSAIGGCPPSV